jgi:hypothetical protein
LHVIAVGRLCRARLLPVEQITRTLLILRGHRVLQRFPADFLFELTQDEYHALKLQFATSKASRGGRRKLPLVFTEHGAIMVAAVLNSPRAVEMSVYVVRAFVKLRKLLGSNKELARRFAQLEARLDKKLAAHDTAIAAILSAIRQLMNPSTPKRRGIGFTADCTGRKFATGS